MITYALIAANAIQSAVLLHFAFRLRQMASGIGECFVETVKTTDQQFLVLEAALRDADAKFNAVERALTAIDGNFEQITIQANAVERFIADHIAQEHPYAATTAPTFTPAQYIETSN